MYECIHAASVYNVCYNIYDMYRDFTIHIDIIHIYGSSSNINATSACL